MAQKALAEKPKDYYCLNTLGAALYRSGQYTAAIGRLNEACKALREGGTAFDWLFLAMAHQRLGQTEQARQWLDKAIQSIDQLEQAKTESLASAVPLQWVYRLELPILRREAEAIVNGAEP